MLTATSGSGAWARGDGHGKPPAPPRGARGHADTIRLVGQVAGTYTQLPSVPDAGGSYRLSGNGTVAPLGTVRAEGTLHTPGFIAHGTTTGDLTLSNPKGTLTLNLTGPQQRGLSDAPTTLRFVVSGGTGAYLGKTGAGVAHLTMTPAKRPPSVPGQRTPHYMVAAQFTLRFGDGG